MSYEEVVEDVVEVIEATGAAIMIVGAIFAFAYWARQVVRGEHGRYVMLRRTVLIIGDIIRTIIVEPTLESVGVLAAIVLIRIVLSFSLEVEIDGAWPWRRGTRKA